MYSDPRRSCHVSISVSSLDISNPNDVLNDSTHWDCIDQNLMVSPPNMISLVGDRIKYLPKEVGP